MGAETRERENAGRVNYQFDSTQKFTSNLTTYTVFGCSCVFCFPSQTHKFESNEKTKRSNAALSVHPLTRSPMDDTASEDAPHPAPPPVVSVAPFSTTRRRLSATFAGRSRPVPSERPPVAWISLQGRLVNAEEASSATTVGLTGSEALAWELFTPIQRFLLVAVIAVAVAESKKNQQIWNLKKSVELRVGSPFTLLLL